MANTERDDESGKYTNTYRPEAFVDAVHDADGVAGTQDVADAVGCSYELAYKRLRALADAGDVESQKVANARVWMATEDTETDNAQAAESGRESAVTAATGTADPAGTSADATPESAQFGDVVERVAEGWEDPDDRLAARKAAARAVLDYAAEQGAVSKQDAVENVRPEYPVEDQDARTWYRKTARPALSEAAAFEYSHRDRAYHFVGDDSTP